MVCCLYCNRRIEAKLKKRKSFIHLISLFTSERIRTPIENVWIICCSQCKKKYEKLDMTNLNWIRTSKVTIHQNAGASFRRIFKNDFDFSKIVCDKVIKGIAKISKDKYHIFITYLNIRAFLECIKIESSFLILDIWRIY